MQPSRSLLMLALIAAIVGLVLFVPPVVGIANNGDFGKISLRYKLWVPHELEFSYAVTVYQIRDDKFWESGFRSSEELFLRAALFLNGAGRATFDMRWIGVLHSLVLLGTLALVIPRLPAGWRGWLLLGVLAFLFCDVWILSYFHSFYMDTAAVLGLLLALAAAVRGNFPLLCAGAALLVFSKAQHYPLALPIGAYLFFKGPRWRAIPAIALLGGAGYALAKLPADYAPITSFNMVFFKIIPLSPEPEKALYALGFDESYRQWIGTHTYSPGSRMEDQVFRAEIGRRAPGSRVAMYLLTHPRTFWAITLDHLGQAALIRVDNLGNYDPGAGKPPGAHSDGMGLWSATRRSIFQAKGGRYLCYALALIGLLLWSGRGMRPQTAALAAITVAAFAIGAYGDGLEVTRHLFLFNVLLDVHVAALAATWLQRAS